MTGKQCQINGSGLASPGPLQTGQATSSKLPNVVQQFRSLAELGGQGTTAAVADTEREGDLCIEDASDCYSLRSDCSEQLDDDEDTDDFDFDLPNMLVSCGDKVGTWHTKEVVYHRKKGGISFRHGTVTCECKDMHESNPMTLRHFEIHGGKGHSQNYMSSIKVHEGGQKVSIEKWLCDNGAIVLAQQDMFAHQQELLDLNLPAKATKACQGALSLHNDKSDSRAAAGTSKPLKQDVSSELEPRKRGTKPARSDVASGNDTNWQLVSDEVINRVEQSGRQDVADKLRRIRASMRQKNQHGLCINSNSSSKTTAEAVATVTALQLQEVRELVMVMVSKRCEQHAQYLQEQAPGQRGVLLVHARKLLEHLAKWSLLGCQRQWQEQQQQRLVESKCLAPYTFHSEPKEMLRQRRQRAPALQ